MRSWDDYKRTIRDEDPILELARRGDLEGLRAQVLSVERLRARNGRGHTALMLAAYHGHESVARHLLEAGADPCTADEGGNTVLMGAAFKGDLAIVRMLLEFGARADETNARGQGALEFATLFGRAEVVRFLKELAHEPAVFGVSDVVKGWKSQIFGASRG